MEQRRPRLGDIVDDYCPRERRITNHAIVAMIEDAVKQTRCTTCDADHDYKNARVPPQRKKKDASALEGPFIEEVHVRNAASDAEDQDADETIADESPESIDDVPAESASDAASADVQSLEAQSDGEEPAGGRDDDGPVHRRLIRATLPRSETNLPERKEIDFTIRQPSRGSRFEHAGNGGQGNRPRHQRGGRGPQAASGGGNGPQRFGGQRQQGQGQDGNGNRPNGNRPGMPGASRPGGRPGGQGGSGGRKRGR